jgi:inhibitor of KinA
VRFQPVGDAAVLAEFGTEIDRTLSRRVFQLHQHVVASRIPGVIASIPAFATLLVQFDPLRTAAGEIMRLLEASMETMAEAGCYQARRWRIPVCYSPALAPDLEEAARVGSLSISDFAALHASACYVVYMLGGFPGFPYLGDVPEPMRIPRRASPRLRVEPGAVALAGRLSAIYPMPTPGGWNLIGRTPIPIFNVAWEEPALLAPGDEVIFHPVSESEFENVAAAVAQGGVERDALMMPA